MLIIAPAINIIMLPEKELIRRSYALRDMRLPAGTKLTKKSLLRWICLSLGLLSPDESRQSVLPILDAFLALQFSGTSPTISQLAEKSGQPEKAVRYHIGKLVAMGLVEEKKRRLSFKMDASSDTLSLPKSFGEYYVKSLVASLSSIQTALAELQRLYEA